MQSELFYKKRATARNDLRSRRKAKSPLEIMTTNIVALSNAFVDDFLLGNRSYLISKNINLDFNAINDLVEEKMSDKQITNLNPAALIGGFMILGQNNSIDSNKVEFLFKKKVNDVPVIQFFHDLKVREADIIRYARLWNHLLQ